MTHFRGNSCLNNLMVFAKDMTDSWATVAIKKISLVRDVRYIILSIYIYYMATHIERVRINRVRLPILVVVS